MKKLFISPDGEAITGLIDPVIDGMRCSRRIHRASNIEYNNITDRWDIEIFETGMKFSTKTRKEALDYEEHVINNLNRAKVDKL